MRFWRSTGVHLHPDPWRGDQGRRCFVFFLHRFSVWLDALVVAAPMPTANRKPNKTNQRPFVMIYSQSN
jgi:hypothetical protein